MSYRKRNQLTRRLPTYHAKQRQCPNVLRRHHRHTTLASREGKSQPWCFNDCFKHSDLLKESTDDTCERSPNTCVKEQRSVPSI